MPKFYRVPKLRAPKLPGFLQGLEFTGFGLTVRGRDLGGAGVLSLRLQSVCERLAPNPRNRLSAGGFQGESSAYV